jgi:hypothetical protein
MEDKKYTLGDLFGDRENKMISLRLLENDLENLLTLTGNAEPMIRQIFSDVQDKYSVMRAICLIDIELHKQGTNNCDVSSNACGLLNTLQAFRARFKQQIEDDDTYSMKDFEWK